MEFIWSLNLRKAMSTSKLIWCAQEELSRDEEKYWYYKTPVDALYGRKKWTTRNYDHLI